MLSGFWHGANYTFIIWGFLHGGFTIIHKILIHWKENSKDIYKKCFSIFEWKPFAIILNFLIVVFCWIFFRADSVSEAFGIIKKIFTGLNEPVFIKTGAWMCVALTGILIIFIVDAAEEYNLNIQLLHHKNFAVRMFTVVAMIFSILLFGILRNTSFIYFQF